MSDLIPNIQTFGMFYHGLLTPGIWDLHFLSHVCIKENWRLIDCNVNIFLGSLDDFELLGGEKWDVIVVGAGMSGLNIAKELKESGINFVVFEKASQPGGTW